MRRLIRGIKQQTLLFVLHPLQGDQWRIAQLELVYATHMMTELRHVGDD